ncbi:MAG TPA: sigma-70 family RNA polymerase sigma factor [Flavisolibacter sp.]|nr:sigma-70 family RNA polymerase sigma factor [Flavisolibacter sp.]
MQPTPVHISQEYVLSFQRGEEIGFNWAFRTFYPALIHYGHKMTGCQELAEEIASGAFLKIWERHHQFHSLPVIRAYLYRVVHNDALQWHRRRKKEKLLQEGLFQQEKGDFEKDHAEAIIQSEVIRHLYQTIGSLPPACGKVFQLLYVEGKTVNETAAILQLSPNTVKSQRKKGLAMLRHSLTTLSSFFFAFLLRH